MADMIEFYLTVSCLCLQNVPNGTSGASQGSHTASYELNETTRNETEGKMNNKDESGFDEILRELDHIREIASNYTPEQIEALQRELAVV
jgi:hypothetical protein